MHFHTNQINFIALLRGLAALLVLWDHLVGMWLNNHGKHWIVYDFITTYVTTPLGIIQDFGWFGVVLFFLISGYIITHIIERETRLVFLIKRIFRIYPPLVISILLIIFVTNNQHTLKDFVYSSTLLNYFLIPQNPINGVAWTLVIEMIFYLSCFLGFSSIKKNPTIFVSALIAISFVLILYSRNFGDNFFLFVASFSYIPYLIMGQILYFFNKKIFTFRTFSTLTVINYFVITYGIISIRPEFYSSNFYSVSFIYAYFIFFVCMIFNNKIKMNPIIQFYSNISFSLYLNHGVIGAILLDRLSNYNISYTIAIVIVLFAVSLLSYLSYNYIELPLNRLVKTFLPNKR